MIDSRYRFPLSLGASLALHAVGFFILAVPPASDKPPKQERKKAIEITYQQAVAATKDAVSRGDIWRDIKNNAELPRRTETAGKELQAARDFSREEISRSPRQQSEPAMEKKIVTLPRIPGEVFKSPEYKSYYYLVREKIRRLAYSLYKKQEEGEVFLTFVLEADGTLLSSVINTQKSTANPYLIEIARMSVCDASPFPPFPEKLKDNKTLSFNVIISFELK